MENRGTGQERTEAAPVVRNRDLRLLRDVWSAMEMVRLCERRIDWQRERLTRITQRYSAQPGGKGGVPSGFEEAFAELGEADEAYMQRLLRYCEALKRAQEVLDGIGSMRMRAFVEMKYLFGMSGRAVMQELNMTEYAYKRARAAVEQAESLAKVEWSESL